jgi:hypothetical protein
MGTVDGGRSAKVCRSLRTLIRRWRSDRASWPPATNVDQMFSWRVLVGTESSSSHRPRVFVRDGAPPAGS